MAARKAKILSIGRNRTLLATRNAILEQAGYEVHTSLEHDEAVQLCSRESFDAAVIGSSVPLEERLSFIEELHRSCPDTKIVLLMKPNEPLYRVAADAVVNSFDPPPVLLDAIAAVLNQGRGG